MRLPFIFFNSSLIISLLFFLNFYANNSLIIRLSHLYVILRSTMPRRQCGYYPLSIAHWVASGLRIDLAQYCRFEMAIFSGFQSLEAFGVQGRLAQPNSWSIQTSPLCELHIVEQFRTGQKYRINANKKQARPFKC